MAVGVTKRAILDGARRKFQCSVWKVIRLPMVLDRQ
uniref:Uncharacterized protein n=1 Tax=Arundo donax TaxID=35708 RepID=A0A0A9A415_ARUDO